MAVQRTPEQEAVVKNRGGALLVSAAAGSGKTRVLVERLMDRILNEGRSIDEFLIITFTRAAAEELRARIGGELAGALRERPEDPHLRRQSALLYKAQISTIHALCTVLLRQWGHLLDIPADFALCEEEDSAVLMGRTLDRVLEARYEAVDPAFAALLDVLTAGRDDSRLADIVLDVFGKLQSDADPIGWLESQRKALDLAEITDVGQTPWGELLLEDAGQTAAYWAEQMEKALDLARRDDVLERAYGDSLSVTAGQLRDYAKAAAESWDAAAGLTVDFPKLKPAKGAQDLSAQTRIKAIRGRCKKAMEDLSASLSGESRELLSDLAMVAPAMEGLIDLVADFSAAYAEEKKRRSLLDFSDLEHFAVKLLVAPDGSPTEVARQWGGQYAEIMVDEYQDTNKVQNAILDALSDVGRNLFMVGDVKQSIYRFRLADPTIFLEKYRAFAPWDRAAEGQPRTITMSKNFRSRPQVLEAANDLFRAIMSRTLGEMDYTDAEALYPGGSFPAGEGYETELHVLDFSDDPALTEDKENRNYLEARFTARRIAALLEAGFPVSDGEGGTRPLRPDDVAILLRSPGPVRHYYTLALEEQGVGWSAEEGGDLFDSTEISAALAWLQIIDNPRQDVPLLAALRAPVWGFTGDKLAEIRTRAEGEYYTALETAAAEGDAECAGFLALLADLRRNAAEADSAAVLWDVYRRLRFLEIFSSMPGGDKRRENLLALSDLARRFESAGHKGLFPFLLHLERVRERGGLRSAPAAPGEGGGVRILSIHRSKGLEYPVVFLCGLGRKLNYSDLQKPVLYHPKYGLGPRAVDRETMVEFNTAARMGVALALKKELLAEEMRLLYVAMTRAKEKLVLVHTLSYGASELQKLADSASIPADPRVLADCTSVGQWVLLTAMARPEGEALRRAAQREDLPLTEVPLGPPWRIACHAGVVSEEVIPAEEEERRTEEPVLSAEEIADRLLWRYPFAAASVTPAKVTATQVARQDEEDPGVFLLRGERETEPFYRPAFAQEALGLTPAQEGTALHTVMQTIRLDRAGDPAGVAEELARLAAGDYLTPLQVRSVDPAAVARFFASPLGRAMAESPDLHREYPFSLLAPAARFFPASPAGEEILLQGVIDAWFPEPDGLTIVDFKSDRISAAAAVERAERYRGQLAAYAWALETLTGLPVRRQILWFLRPGVPVRLESYYSGNYYSGN